MSEGIRINFPLFIRLNGKNENYLLCVYTAISGRYRHLDSTERRKCPKHSKFQQRAINNLTNFLVKQQQKYAD